MLRSIFQSNFKYLVLIVGLIILLASLMMLRKISRNLFGSSPSFAAISSVQTGYIGLNVNNIIDIDNRLGCDVNQPADKFRVTEIRTGNSIEGYYNVASCYAESDFMMTKDDKLVSTHDSKISNNCSAVEEITYEEAATCILQNGRNVGRLSDFLALPISEWFIDLKPTAGKDDKYVVASVKVAVDEIKRFGRQDGAVVMLYRAPQEAVDLLKQNGIRAGMKGYPKNPGEARKMVETASANGFELACMNISFMNKEFLEYSKGLSVWLLAWEGGEVPTKQWKVLSDEGMGGLITLYPEEALATLGSK